MKPMLFTSTFKCAGCDQLKETLIDMYGEDYENLFDIYDVASTDREVAMMVNRNRIQAVPSLVLNDNEPNIVGSRLNEKELTRLKKAVILGRSN